MAKYEEDYEKYDDELDDELYDNNPSQRDIEKTLKGYKVIIVCLVAVLALITFQHFRLTADEHRSRA